MQGIRLLVAAGIVVGGTLAPARPAAARSEKLLGYSPASVWSPLVRFLRVDENLKIVDKDVEAGYLIFELTQDKKVFRGSAELIPASKDHGARVILDVSDRPSYVELAMLERLERKLLAELGPPPSPPKKPEGGGSGKAKDKDESGGGKAGEGEKPKAPAVREAPMVPLPETPASPPR